MLGASVCASLHAPTVTRSPAQPTTIRTLATSLHSNTGINGRLNGPIDSRNARYCMTNCIWLRIAIARILGTSYDHDLFCATLTSHHLFSRHLCRGVRRRRDKTVAPVILPDALRVVTVSPSTGNVIAGQTLSLSVAIDPASSSVVVTSTFASGHRPVATVSAAGVVSGVSAGTSVITVSSTGSVTGFTTTTKTATATSTALTCVAMQ